MKQQKRRDERHGTGEAETAASMVVGIGASAGGVEALQAFFKSMPTDSGAAFVAILHLQREQKSHLAEILGRCTGMPVAEVTHSTRVRPNHVYIIPPGRVLELKGDALELSELPEPRLQRKPVDAFFRSLATARGPGAVAIVLSGTGGNGSMGVRDVKGQGGILLVQDPTEAAYPDMPRHAISTGIVDRILPIEQMAAVITGYAEHPYVRERQADVKGAEPWDKLNRILELIRKATGREFRCYKKNTLLRRTQRRMGLRQITSFDAYEQLLRDDKTEVKALADDLLIGVTSFFRDFEAWQALQHEVLSKLFADRPADETVRAWVPGCASGEEAYTLAILLYESAQQAKWQGEIKVFASDTAPQRLQQAREGCFPDSIEADLSEELLERHFERKGDTYQVRPVVRDSVIYAPHDLIADPPFSQLDLITCRNLLIYLEPETQARVLALFHFALKPGGHLFLGTAETVSQQAGLFETVEKKWRIYRRIGPTRHDLVTFPVYGSSKTRSELERLGKRPPNTGRFRVADLVHRALADAYGPAAVLVNRQFDATFFHGKTDRYLAQPAGARTGHVLEMARDGLRAKLREVIDRAIEKDQKAVEPEARVRRDGDWTPVRLTAVPLRAGPVDESLVLVTFEDTALPAERTDRPERPVMQVNEGEEGNLIRQIEQELQATRHELQSTIEDLENANEEQRATNEEISSMNEELQSGNEELETSKEELQSLNEELTTVNQQLHTKVQELESANNDLSNLLASTDVATVFLDTEFRIRWFAPSVRDLLPVIESDIGRSIGDLSHRFHDPAMLDDARQVLEKLIPVTQEVNTDDGRWYIRRTLPYRTRDNRIDGVVITFSEVTHLKQAQARERLLAAVVRDSNDAIIVANLDGRIMEWNRGAVAMYGWTADEAASRDVHGLAPPEEHPRIDAMLQALSEKHALASAEAERLTKDGRRMTVSITTTLLRDDRGEPHAIAITERDITAMKKAQQRQEQFTAELERCVAERTATAEQRAEQLRKLSLDLSRAEENERRRIAHVLHEDLQQMLAGARFTLNAVRHNPGGDQNALIGRLEQSLDEALDRTRNLSHELSPPILQEGLLPALHWTARWYKAKQNLRIAVKAQPAAEPSTPDLRYMLYSVARELLFNIAKHAETDEAEVYVERHGSTIRLTVIDHGKGFDQNQTGIDGSSNLFGLMTVRERISSLGGQMRIVSKPGDGTRITLTVPDAEPSAPAEAGLPAMAAGNATDGARPGAGIRIVLVDDHEVMRHGLRLLLGRYPDLEVIAEANSGEAAIGVVEQHRPDVVLMDVNMPGMGGVEATRRIALQFPEVAIVALSMYEAADRAQTMLDAGAVAYVQKAAPADELANAIHAAARKADETVGG